MIVEAWWKPFFGSLWLGPGGEKKNHVDLDHPARNPIVVKLWWNAMIHVFTLHPLLSLDRCGLGFGWKYNMIVDLNHPTRNPIEVKWWWNAIYSFLFSSPFSWDRIYGNVFITWIQILCWCSIYFGEPGIVINSLNSWTRGQVILLSSAPGTSSSARSHPYDSAGSFGGAGGWWTCQPKVIANLNLASDDFFIYVIYFVGFGLHQSYGSG